MKKRILLIICFVITFVLSFFAGFLISKLDLFKEKEPEVNNILNGNTFYLNEDGKSYIKFTSNEDYEYRFNSEDNNYKQINGKYTLSNDNVTLDNKEKFTIKNDILILENKNIIYFNSKNMVDEIIKLRNIAKEYVDEIKKNDPNLAYPKDVKAHMNTCYSLDDNRISCNITYDIYFDNYIKSVCDELDNDRMFFPYTGYTGYCENEYIRNTNYFEMKRVNNTYKLNRVTNKLNVK